MRRIIAAAFALVIAASAQAQPAPGVSQRDWQTFMGESYARYRDAQSPRTLEDQLFALGEHANAATAIARFARDLNVDAATAQSYAQVIVEAVRRREECSERRSCAFEPGVRIYDLAVNVAMEEQSGGLLAVIGMNLSDDADASFIRPAATHRATANVVSRIFLHNEDAAYLVALLAVRPVSEDNARLMNAAAPGPDFGPDYWNGWYDAQLEAAERDLAEAAPFVRAAVAQLALNRKFEIGAADEALRAYSDYPDQVRALLPLAPTCGECSDRRGEMSRANAQHLADNLTAALWTAGRREAALELLHRGVDAFGARDADAEGRYRALSEALEPQLSADALYQHFIIDAGFTPRGSALSLNNGGWLFAVAARGPLRDVIAARVRAAGFEDMARYLFERAYWPRETGPDTLRQLAALSNAAPERQIYWQDRIGAYAAEAPAEPAGALRVATAPIEPWWTQTRLPGGAIPWRETDRAPAPPSGLALPMPVASIVRFERRGGDMAIVYQSSQYDQPGEVPTYGLWLAHTIDQVWQRPIYLGLQTYFPYLPTSGSSVPMLDGDALRLEVQVREIDRQSITFPPIDLSVVRSEEGAVLEFSLARLRQDGDADGLADIEERRIGLPIDNADADGDGLNDGVDPLPLTRFDAAAPASRRLLAEAILGQIMGHESAAIIIAPLSSRQISLEEDLQRVLGGADAPPRAQIPTIFLSGDPELFSGLQSRVRLMIYSKRDVEALSNGSSPFYPPRITNIFSSPDGRTHFVIWSADWVGGRFIVRCTDAACQTETVSSWIT